LLSHEMKKDKKKANTITVFFCFIVIDL